MDLSKASSTDLLKEIKKLRQENQELKTQNNLLTRKEISYAQKFSKLSKEVSIEDTEIKDLLQKYNNKSLSLEEQLLTISDRLDKFTSDKNNYNNYKEESEVYKSNLDKLKKDYDIINGKYLQLFNQRNDKLCECLIERFTLIPAYSQRQSPKKRNSRFFDFESQRTSNQVFKNELMFEIKEFISNNNINNNYNNTARNLNNLGINSFRKTTEGETERERTLSERAPPLLNSLRKNNSTTNTNRYTKGSTTADKDKITLNDCVNDNMNNDKNNINNNSFENEEALGNIQNKKAPSKIDLLIQKFDRIKIEKDNININPLSKRNFLEGEVSEFKVYDKSNKEITLSRISFFDGKIHMEFLPSNFNVKTIINPMYSEGNLDAIQDKLKGKVFPISFITSQSYSNEFPSNLFNHLYTYLNEKRHSQDILSDDNDFFDLSATINSEPSILLKYSSLEKERPLAFITHSNSENSVWKNTKFIQKFLSINFLPIIVISFLTESQISFINEFFSNKQIYSKTIILIHNISTISRRADAEYYIQNYILHFINKNKSTVKKNYMLSIREINRERPEGKNFWYYHQKTPNNINIIHLIYAESNSEAGYYYNDTTIECIDTILKEKFKNINKSFDFKSLEENLKSFYSHNYKAVEDESSADEEEEEDKTFEPEFSYEVRNGGKCLVIVVDICDYFCDLNINVTDNVEFESYEINITGERIMKYSQGEENDDESMGYSNRKNGKFDLFFSVGKNKINGLNLDRKKIIYEGGSLIVKIPVYN
ncbi:MAG: hypothetical protein MJ252_23645 [archaeon]|nr:hypothetical protein [archaeon]